MSERVFLECQMTCHRMPEEFPGRMSPDEMSNGMPGIMPS
jgi:hypothetical protein